MEGSCQYACEWELECSMMMEADCIYSTPSSCTHVEQACSSYPESVSSSQDGSLSQSYTSSMSGSPRSTSYSGIAQEDLVLVSRHCKVDCYSVMLRHMQHHAALDMLAAQKQLVHSTSSQSNQIAAHVAADSTDNLADSLSIKLARLQCALMV